jgi:hypothetical protein
MAVSVCKICGYRPRVTLWEEYLSLNAIPNVIYKKGPSRTVAKVDEQPYKSNFISQKPQPIRKPLLIDNNYLALANQQLFFSDDELNLVN